jgi:putative inorganic carbon (hco3(-)) transporter
LITQKQQYGLFLLLMGSFIAVSGWMIAQGELWPAAIPAALLMLYLGMFHFDVFIWSAVLFTPISIGLDELGFGLGISLPSEPILAGALVILLLRQLHHSYVSRDVLFHPVTIVLLLQLGWMIFTTFTSSMPEVSAKAVTARAWFMGVMCFGTVMMYRYKISNVRTMTWLYVLPLLVVVIYASFRLISFGLDKQFAHFSMQPFYKDHAVYAACIAMFVPLVGGFAFYKKYSGTYRFLAATILVVLLIGLLLSYTRAAWLSVVAALVVWAILRFKIQVRYVLVAVTLAGAVFAVQYDQIIMDLQRNKTDSSDNFSEHVESMSNISTDASNLERINRWNSALRMFSERPLTGWGPGTYAFQYAPFQHSSELTIISTNAGTLGNAHSEYLGPLAESGIPGFLLSIGLVVAVFWRCVTMYKRIVNDEARMVMVCAFMGLITYFTHGFLNNYLDQDKAAVPFYALLAIIIAIDLWHVKPKAAEEIRNK